jgi:hypothetical protein
MRIILGLPLILATIHLTWGQQVSYPELKSVTRIEIRAEQNSLIREITSPDHISRILSFVNQRRTGWKAPWYGVPVPSVVANFYDGDLFKGHFGVGRGFFETQRGNGFNSKSEEAEDGFYSKSATRKELDDFIVLIGVSRDLVYGEPKSKAKSGDDSPIDVPANLDWTPSGRLVKPGDRILITATGEVQLDRSGLSCGPQGIDTQDKGKIIPGKPTGALIAVIGANNDDYIHVGSRAEFVSARHGLIFLGVNDGDLSDNSGSYKVSVKIDRGK